MSRHVPRKDRWSLQGADRYRSLDGLVVRLYKGQWWVDVVYEVLVGPGEEDGVVMEWRRQTDQLGPFRRPRNAMVEAERHVTYLRNRHGERVRLLEG